MRKYALALDKSAKCVYKQSPTPTLIRVKHMMQTIPKTPTANTTQSRQSAAGTHNTYAAQTAGPEARFNAGNISATIWSNVRKVEGRDVSIKTVSVQKSYKDKDGVWKQTTSFHANDLPKAKLVLEKAYEHLAMTQIATE